MCVCVCVCRSHVADPRPAGRAECSRGEKGGEKIKWLAQKQANVLTDSVFLCFRLKKTREEAREEKTRKQNIVFKSIKSEFSF